MPTKRPPKSPPAGAPAPAAPAGPLPLMKNPSLLATANTPKYKINYLAADGTYTDGRLAFVGPWSTETINLLNVSDGDLQTATGSGGNRATCLNIIIAEPTFA